MRQTDFGAQLWRVYRLVGFDFDGTLADSGDWFIETLNQLAAEFGFKTLPPEDRERARSFETRKLIEHLQLPIWKLPLLVNRMRTLGARDRDRISLFPGVDEVFAELEAAGAQIAIVSSNTEETIRHTLRHNASKVAYYRCGSSLFGKAAMLRALIRTARIPAAETVYVGDETRDGLAAKQARVDFAAVSWGYASVEALRAHSPRFVFERMDDIVREFARKRLKDKG